MTNAIKVICFDADDTLWENETFFREAELEFADLMNGVGSKELILNKLFAIEVANLPIYGYGIKAFTLSMLETAVALKGEALVADTVERILSIAKAMLNKPVVLLDGVEEVLQQLSAHYRLVVATKGDLLDQERKLEKSGLLRYFHHIEVMSDKQPASYRKLIKHLDIQSHEFAMIGNSLKSDVLPVVEIGGLGIHVPFHTTWHHELVENKPTSDRLIEIVELKEVLQMFSINSK